MHGAAGFVVVALLAVTPVIPVSVVSTVVDKKYNKHIIFFLVQLQTANCKLQATLSSSHLKIEHKTSKNYSILL